MTTAIVKSREEKQLLELAELIFPASWDDAEEDRIWAQYL